MKKPETPKEKRNALWEGAKEIQSRQADVTRLQHELNEASSRLARTLSDYGFVVQAVLPDEPATEEDK